MALASREKPLQSTSTHHHHDWLAAAAECVSGFMTSGKVTVPEAAAPVNAPYRAIDNVTGGIIVAP
jgi:hypothetical protein